jgi:phosphoenolpyruvate---glycerone phosphotransferase subunit DhaL
MPEQVDAAGLLNMILAGAEKVRAHHKSLSELDSAIGDGDHGITMLRAVDAITKSLQDGSRSLKELLYDAGWAVMSIDGGATGPLLGSFFMGLSEGTESRDSFDSGALASMFEAGLKKVQAQTRAQVGDKTLLDALVPAVTLLREAAGGQTPAGAMARAAEAAARGAEATRDMQARFGRARNLGPRTVGCVDPGAASISYLFQGFRDGLSP